MRADSLEARARQAMRDALRAIAEASHQDVQEPFGQALGRVHSIARRGLEDAERRGGERSVAAREWTLLVCPSCGEAVTVDDLGPEIYCNGAVQTPEKHRMVKMVETRVREVPDDDRA